MIARALLTVLVHTPGDRMTMANYFSMGIDARYKATDKQSPQSVLEMER